MALFVKIILLPISFIYGLIVKFRNFLYNFKVFKSTEFDIPIIVVGNLTVGGTGKTPVSEYLITLLSNHFAVAFLSRGYRRKTKGYVLADTNSSPRDIGDEPFQVKQKFENLIVAVDEKRVRGISNLLKIKTKPDVIILDDAYQHRSVKPGLSILIIDYSQPIERDFFIPSGRLRDSVKEKDRADIVLITKSPDSIRPIDMRIMHTELKIKAFQSLFFSGLNYQNLRSLSGESSHDVSVSDLKNKDILLLTGIGNTKPILLFCKEKTKSYIHLSYKDHHDYSIKDLKTISDNFNLISSQNKIILTTEKDAVKLNLIIPKNHDLIENIYFVPIKIKILNNEQEVFNSIILNFVKKV